MSGGDDLVAFWIARLDEEEAAANAVDDHYSTPHTYNAWLVDIARILGGDVRPGVVEHIARHDPARALREVAADRAVLALLEQPVVFGRERDYDATEALEQVARIRAAVWSGHPDYRQEWKP